MYFWSYSFTWPPVHWPSPDWLLVLPLVLTLVGFLPSIIAFARGHHNRFAILALNVFLGWTLIGWVLALVWALTAVRRNPPVAACET